MDMVLLEAGGFAIQVIALTAVIKKFLHPTMKKKTFTFVFLTMLVSAFVVLSQRYIDPVINQVITTFCLSTICYDNGIEFLENFMKKSKGQ